MFTTAQRRFIFAPISGHNCFNILLSTIVQGRYIHNTIYGIIILCCSKRIQGRSILYDVGISRFTVVLDNKVFFVPRNTDHSNDTGNE